MISDSRIEELCAEYGTPLYVFDTDVLADRVKKIKALSENVKLCFSMKANPFVTEFLCGGYIDSVEVCSSGELEICKRLDLPPKMIVLSGVNRAPSELKTALDYGVRLFTAESIHQFELLRDTVGKCDASVILRLNAGAQFGMSETDMLKIVKGQSASENHGLRVIGLHYHVGTQRRNAGYELQRKELKMCLDLMKRLSVEGTEMRLLQYGPGLPMPLFDSDDFSDDCAPLKAIAEELAAVAKSVEVTVEMGRFLTAPCGCYLTSVADVKAVGNKKYCITDGGIHQLVYDGNMMGLKHPIMHHLRTTEIMETPEEPGTELFICGSLCTTNDMLVRAADLRNPKIGDCLAFFNSGAYSMTEGMALFLSRPLPKVVLLHDERSELVRDSVDISFLNTPTYSLS